MDVNALIDIDPDTLNKKSRGRWVTVFIILPEDYGVAEIDVTTIEITSLVSENVSADYNQPADLRFAPQVGDRDKDGILDLTVKFDRTVLLSNLLPGDVTITIEGDLLTGVHFRSSDTIRVIEREK